MIFKEGIWLQTEGPIIGQWIVQLQHGCARACTENMVEPDFLLPAARSVQPVTGQRIGYLG